MKNDYNFFISMAIFIIKENAERGGVEIESLRRSAELAKFEALKRVISELQQRGLIRTEKRDNKTFLIFNKLPEDIIINLIKLHAKTGGISQKSLQESLERLTFIHPYKIESILLELVIGKKIKTGSSEDGYIFYPVN